MAAEKFKSFEEFLRRVGIGPREFQRYQSDGLPTPRFLYMASLFGLSPDEFKERLVGQRAAGMALTPAASRDAERRFNGYQHEGLYDHAAALAAECLEQAKAAGATELAMSWYYRLASASRVRGDLRTASMAYRDALSFLEEHRDTLAHRMSIQLQEGRLRFGQIHNDLYQMLGAFAEARAGYEQLLETAARVLPSLAEPERLQALYGKLHLQRGIAEMTRFLGRYNEAAEMSDQIARAYPGFAEAAAWWARLGAADARRLDGRLNGDDGAKVRYLALIDEARWLGPTAEGRLGSALLRLARIHQLEENTNAHDDAVEQATKIAKEVPGRYRLLEVYVHLHAAAGPARNPLTAEQHLRRAEEGAGLARDYLTLEYAHLWLCRGELARSRSDRQTQAKDAFEKALAAYCATGALWGILRAWIGATISGLRGDIPLDPAVLQGTDLALWEQFRTNPEIPRGHLSMNFP